MNVRPETKKQLLLLVLVDITGGLLAIISAYWLRVLLSDYIPYHKEHDFLSHIWLFLYSVPVQLIIFRGVGIYGRHNLLFGSFEYVLALKACTYYVLALVFISFAVRDFYPSRLWLLGTWMFVIFYVCAGRFFTRIYFKRICSQLRERALIIGVSEETTIISQRLEEEGFVQIVGFLDDFASQGTQVWRGRTVLGVPSKYETIAEKEGVTLIIALLDAIGWESRKEVIQLASKERDLDIQIAPGIGEFHLMAMEVNFKGNLPLLRFRLGYVCGLDSVLKQGMDYLFGFIAFILTIPVFVLIALMYLMKGQWPIIDKIEVLGKEGRPFQTYKFLTGFSDSNILRRFKDISVPLKETKLARFQCFLFRTGLDKVPQLINVLSGKMSLVGPRTVSPKNRRSYGEWLPSILSVKPGITGLWVFSDKVGLEEEILLTSMYIRDWDIWRDAVILWRTTFVGFRHLFGRGEGERGQRSEKSEEEGRDLNDYRKVPVPKNAGVFRPDHKPLSLRVRKD